ncbi:FtsK/SpoIIIE domain-containing protein [Pullulanibacillus sp. KACC 23026]|uniref:FtsK/SpoIIIE domain-containing protein n=1 Tax=Pullulanibacillus sp. KACC 23026 TaxID=3028315 RepID=UPI0023AF90C1|nr:FtsK/SpoIIIE domain-containing protein [Pullulanibacillus sp. KACC 23026]WEG14022.1 FtsK/SpoIIIE domain-containing protein [Pullulanibacillus sp. KACC 23026]
MFAALSTVVMGSVAGYSFLKSRTNPMSDADKINRIFLNSGLYVTENKKLKNIRLFKKRKIENGVEYVFQLPLGMPFKEVENHKNVIQDGLNVKGFVILSFRDFKQINWRKNPIPQIRKLLDKKLKAIKEVELEFDGMLKVRVYEDLLSERIDWEDSLLGKSWSIPVGMTRNGMIYHDFEELPHLLVAGSTGYGKSQFLKMMITSLVMQEGNNVEFTLIDLKGGTAFQRFKDLRQVKHYGKSPEDASKVLPSIQKGMNEKLEWIVDKGFEDVNEAGDPKRHFIFIDEAADIADDKDAMEIVKDIARRGRAAGYRLIYATQYPTTETIPSQVKRNIVSRISFVLDTNTASRAVLDDGGAEELPDIKGRAIYKRLKKQIVQTPYITNSQIEERVSPHITIRPRSENDESLSLDKEAEDGSYTIES